MLFYGCVNDPKNQDSTKLRGTEVFSSMIYVFAILFEDSFLKCKLLEPA